MEVVSEAMSDGPMSMREGKVGVVVLLSLSELEKEKKKM